MPAVENVASKLFRLVPEKLGLFNPPRSSCATSASPVAMDLPQKAVSGILIVFAVAVLAFVATGLCDYLYVRYIVGQFELGLSNIDFANPHLGKALVAALTSTVTLLFFRTGAISPGWIIKLLGPSAVAGYLIAGAHLVAGISTYGHYFDALGKSLLHYEITYDNKVLFFSNHSVSPYTGRPLKEVTPAVVHNLEIRRKRGKFEEVLSPKPEDWWSSGTREPLLWYSKRNDGIHVFNMDGFDPATNAELAPVSPEIQNAYYDQKRAEEQKRNEERKRAEEQAAKRKLAEQESRARELAKKPEQKPTETPRAQITPVASQTAQPASTPAPSPSRPTWFERNISPVVGAFIPKVTVNVAPAAPSRPVRSVPYHSLCGTNHFRNAVCPATGRAYTP